MPVTQDRTGGGSPAHERLSGIGPGPTPPHLQDPPAAPVKDAEFTETEVAHTGRAELNSEPTTLPLPLDEAGKDKLDAALRQAETGEPQPVKESVPAVHPSATAADEGAAAPKAKKDGE